MNKMMYKEINVNKILYKTLTTTNFNSKNIRFLFKSTKIKKGGLTCPALHVVRMIGVLGESDQYRFKRLTCLS